jgi:hypothetical protein
MIILPKGQEGLHRRGIAQSSCDILIYVVLG